MTPLLGSIYEAVSFDNIHVQLLFLPISFACNIFMVGDVDCVIFIVPILGPVFSREKSQDVSLHKCFIDRC